MTCFKAYVDYDPQTDECTFGEVPEWDKVVPLAVYHRCVVRFWLPDHCQYVEDEFMPWFRGRYGAELRKLQVGHSVEWDGSNYVGRWEDHDAANDLQFFVGELIEGDHAFRLLPCLFEWDADNWYDGAGGNEVVAEKLGITGTSTDEELAEREGRLDGETHDGPSGEKVVLVQIGAYLRHLRDWMAENVDEEQGT